MVELLNQWLPNVMDRPDVFIKSIQETFIMVGWSGAISFVVGLFLGVLITVTKPGNILEHPLVYQIIDKMVNLFRSVPFIILLACLVPLSRLIMGTAIGVKGAIVPLKLLFRMLLLSQLLHLCCLFSPLPWCFRSLLMRQVPVRLLMQVQ